MGTGVIFVIYLTICDMFIKNFRQRRRQRNSLSLRKSFRALSGSSGCPRIPLMRLCLLFFRMLTYRQKRSLRSQVFGKNYHTVQGLNIRKKTPCPLGIGIRLAAGWVEERNPTTTPP